MKRFRSLLIPVACFAAAWLLSRSIGKHFANPSPPPPVVVTAPTKTKRERPGPGKISVEELADDFRTRPMNEWAARWEGFASHASAEDLQKLPPLFPGRRDGFSAQGDELLQVLGREELAMRAGRPVELAPESFAALAESDPSAAWKNLAENNRSDFSAAAMRTLAASNPAEALRRFQAMPEGSRGPVDEGRRAAVWHTPIGAIFGAWARRDPAAAAAAVGKLPPADRTEAANQVGMTWAFRDGPAAIRYILDFDKSGEKFTSRHLRLDVMMRASFRTHPEETSRLMAETPLLRKVMVEPPNLYVAVKPWLEADPEGALAWLLDPRTPPAANAIAWLGLDRDPGTAARILRGLAANGSPPNQGLLITLYRRDPEFALSLAAELGIPLREDPRLEKIRIADDPAGACDRWLAALDRHGDPAEALAALGWSGDIACGLAAQAARALPDKAAALAKLVPASSLDSTNLWRRNNRQITLYWPELADALKNPDPKPGKPPFPNGRFRYDPAKAAEELLASEPDANDVTKAVERWAPHDPTAAGAWIRQLPEGAARDSGELAFAKSQADSDPEAALRMLDAREGNDPASRQVREHCVRRLLYADGDWKHWLARYPEWKDSHFAGSLGGEAKLLDLIRRSGGQ